MIECKAESPDARFNTSISIHQALFGSANQTFVLEKTSHVDDKSQGSNMSTEMAGLCV